MKASEKCNCELDQDDFLTVDILNDVDVTQNQTNINHQESEPAEKYKNNRSDILFQTSSSSSSESEPENIENTKTTLEDCSITYFAGYFAKRCVDNFNCTYCKNIMLTDKEDIDQNKMLILYKTFEHIDPLSTGRGGLKMPTNWQINVCRISLKIFENHFQNIKSEVKIVSIMKKMIITKLNKNMPDFKNFLCPQHVECRLYDSSIINYSNI